MRLAIKCLKLSALVGLLGICVWTVGCGEQSTPPKSNGALPSAHGDASSLPASGVDVPEMPADSGVEKPAEAEGDKPADAGDKPAEGDKPADTPESKTEDKKPDDESK
ncbi:MAG TPA: hypothetical protein VK137_17085 [Planctomycetaceae bacterium]|nr:hypothetical protein [Planctomycetaceae bacterium]